MTTLNTGHAKNSRNKKKGLKPSKKERRKKRKALNSPIISVENCEENSFPPRKIDIESDNNEILSSYRIKQRRATVTPAELPMGHLPRYLRGPNRYGNGTSRRQSLPVASLNNKLGTANYSQKIPLKLKQKLDEIDGALDETTSAQNSGQKSFPLDNRLIDCEHNEINNSSDRSSGFRINSKSNIPQICEQNSQTQSNNDLKILTNSTPSFNPKSARVKKTTLSIGSYEQPRRHSIAVSVLSDPHRIGIDSPMPGRAGFGRFENSHFNSKDGVIIVEPRNRRLSVKPVGPYIPKPDNHLLLSIFSFLCCCPLLGLIALIYSVQVDMKYENGKKEESVFKSKNARCWALMAVMIGMLTILGGTLYAVIVLAILA